VSRALRRPEVSPRIRLVITAWEIMTPEERHRLLERLGLVKLLRGRQRLF
jgi:hypothetical protein